MPDPNKFEKLRQIGYSIVECCGNCGHADFRTGSDWGSCGLHLYTHAKHGIRGVSVHRSGVCGDVTGQASLCSELGAHSEFLTTAIVVEAGDTCILRPPGGQSH